jgi:hypothetical protein
VPGAQGDEVDRGEVDPGREVRWRLHFAAAHAPAGAERPQERGVRGGVVQCGTHVERAWVQRLNTMTEVRQTAFKFAFWDLNPNP